MSKQAKREAAKMAKEAKKQEKLNLDEMKKIKRRDEKVQRQLEKLRKQDRDRAEPKNLPGPSSVFVLEATNEVKQANKTWDTAKYLPTHKKRTTCRLSKKIGLTCR